jgi:glycosyltransferase involved in cell wall biosynthesis
MRIAVDIRSLMEGRHSGVEEYTIHIVRHLVKVAPRHTYHVFYNSAGRVRLPPLPVGVRVHSFRYANRLFNLAQWLASRPRWDKLVPADVFFVPNPRLMPLVSSTPLVTVAHDLSFARFPEFLTIRRRLWHRIMRPRQLMQRSNHIIAVSEHTKQDVTSLYQIPPDKITVVCSGISGGLPPARATQVQRLRQKYSLPGQFILYFGTYEPRKNVPGVIQAFSSIAEKIPHHLVIAGERGWREGTITQAIQDSDQLDKIHRVGFVPEHEKAALYAAADLFVYPSFYEGFGFPPLEALVAGTPVVTSFNSALPEVVGRWATLVDPYNPGQQAAVMYELLLNPQRVPVETRQAIRRIYSWDRAARETIKVIENVA